MFEALDSLYFLSFKQQILLLASQISLVWIFLFLLLKYLFFLGRDLAGWFLLVPYVLALTVMQWCEQIRWCSGFVSPWGCYEYMTGTSWVCEPNEDFLLASAEMDQGVCVAAVCLCSHAHTDTHTAFPVLQCMHLVHFVLQSMLNTFGVCRKWRGCRGNIWTVETIREHVHIYQYTLKTLICFLPYFLFKLLKAVPRESQRLCARG